MSIIIFIIVLVVLILVHEVGHFFSAKRAGIRIDEFGIGFPPRLFGKKIGETIYSVNAIPFGGFVQIFGEDPRKEEAITGPDSSRSFVNKPKIIQSLVLFAGVGFNIILAWILFSVSFTAGMPTAADNPLVNKQAGTFSGASLTIVAVLPDSPAEDAGFKSGDELIGVSANGERVSDLTSKSVSDFIAAHGDGEINIEYKRGDELQSLSVLPSSNIITAEPERNAIGISMGIVGTLKLPVYLAVWEAGKLTTNLLAAIAVAIIGLIASALTLSADLSQIAGPVGIVSFVGDAAALGFVALLNFTAIISLNLAIINLLPFPALDGGRILFVAIEAVKGSPIRPKIASILNTLGFAILILAMLAVTYNDILKLF
jgi:regulator of sigma E protease